MVALLPSEDLVCVAFFRASALTGGVKACTTLLYVCAAASRLLLLLLLLLIRRLQEAVREAEAEGEQLLGQLASGELSVEAFVERYTRAQAQYHQRDLKLQAAQQTLPSLSG